MRASQILFSGRARRLCILIIAVVLSFWLVWPHLFSRVFFGNGAPRAAANPAATQTRPIPVRVEEAVREDFPVYFTSLGTVTALKIVTVKSRVDGQIVGVRFADGSMVDKGDPLFEIDPRPYQAALTQAEGQLARDQALLLNARQNLKRSLVLLPKQSTTPQDVDNNRALVSQYEGTVKMDEGQVEAARLQLEFTRITAPLGGRIGLNQMDCGNLVFASAGTDLAVITQVRPIRVRFTVTDTQLPILRRALSQGGKPRVEAWNREKKTLLAVGVFDSLDNQININTGTVLVQGIFDNKDEALFPNQFVNAKIQVDTVKDACVAPTAAIQLGNQGSYVYVVGPDNRTALRQVRPGPGDDDRTVIASGVTPGERLVIDGLDRLGDKSLVTVVNTLGKTPTLNEPPESSAPSGQAAPGGAGGTNTGDPPPAATSLRAR